jgi:hypothetical protein
MRHPAIRSIHAYWNDIRAGRRTPNRTDVNPIQIGKALPDVFLLDAPERGSSFRLAGTRIAAALGREPTGLIFTELFTEAARTNARAALSVATGEGEPILIGIRAVDPTQEQETLHFRSMRTPHDTVRRMTERRMEPRRAGEMVLLPLMHQGQVGARLLGALAMFATAREREQSPIYLDITGTRVLGVSARPTSGSGLISGERADLVIARRGHLTLMRGLIEDKPGQTRP